MSTILLIEPDPNLAQSLNQILQQANFSVQLLTDGAEGFMSLQNSKPGLVIIDENAETDGAGSFLKNVQADLSIGFMPVVVIGNGLDIDAWREQGACDVLDRQNFVPEQVLQQIQKCFSMGGGMINDENMTTTPISAPAQAIAPQQQRTVLIVEDDQFLSELSQAKLEKAGFRVLTALDGEIALDTVLKNQPDIILLDILLPGIDGFEVLSRLKSHSDPTINSIPVLLLSNYGQEDKIQKGMSLGAVDYLIKANFTTNEIVNKLQSVLDTYAK